VRDLVDKEDTQKSKNVRILMDDYGLDRQGIENGFQIRKKHGKTNKQKLVIRCLKPPSGKGGFTLLPTLPPTHPVSSLSL